MAGSSPVTYLNLRITTTATVMMATYHSHADCKLRVMMSTAIGAIVIHAARVSTNRVRSVSRLTIFVDFRVEEATEPDGLRGGTPSIRPRNNQK